MTKKWHYDCGVPEKWSFNQTAGCVGHITESLKKHRWRRKLKDYSLYIFYFSCYFLFVYSISCFFNLLLTQQGPTLLFSFQKKSYWETRVNKKTQGPLINLYRETRETATSFSMSQMDLLMSRNDSDKFFSSSLNLNDKQGSIKQPSDFCK
jgi:hypothetical protein